MRNRCASSRDSWAAGTEPASKKKWGGRWDSNPRQPRSQPGALPAELRPPLSKTHFNLQLARPAGVEPATTGLEGRCSIQLSYGRSRNGSLPQHPWTSSVGRGSRIRTCDPLLPKQMRYQTAPCPEPMIISPARDIATPAYGGANNTERSRAGQFSSHLRRDYRASQVSLTHAEMICRVKHPLQPEDL